MSDDYAPINEPPCRSDKRRTRFERTMTLRAADVQGLAKTGGQRKVRMSPWRSVSADRGWIRRGCATGEESGAGERYPLPDGAGGGWDTTRRAVTIAPDVQRLLVPDRIGNRFRTAGGRRENTPLVIRSHAVTTHGAHEHDHSATRPTTCEPVVRAAVNLDQAGTPWPAISAGLSPSFSEQLESPHDGSITGGSGTGRSTAPPFPRSVVRYPFPAIGLKGAGRLCAEWTFLYWANRLTMTDLQSGTNPTIYRGADGARA